MPLLFYPSFQTLELAQVIFDQVADRVDGYVGRLGVAWYWRLAGGTLVTFRLDYTVTEERWDTIRAEATNPRSGLVNAAEFPFSTYGTALSSPPYIHDLQGAAEWANRLYFNMGIMISQMTEWLQLLHAVTLSPHVTPPAAFPYLDALEREMVRHGVEHLDGRFSIKELYQVFGGRVSRRRLSSLAREWEALGLLTPRPRRVTYALRALIESEG